MPERLRETFTLYLEKQESYQEVVTELHISYSNVRKRISQARAILREQYQEYEVGRSPQTPLETRDQPQDVTSLLETQTFVSSGEPSEVPGRGEAFEPIDAEEPVMAREDSQSGVAQLVDEVDKGGLGDLGDNKLVVTSVHHPINVQHPQSHNCHQPNRTLLLGPQLASSQQFPIRRTGDCWLHLMGADLSVGAVGARLGGDGVGRGWSRTRSWWAVPTLPMQLLVNRTPFHWRVEPTISRYHLSLAGKACQGYSASNHSIGADGALAHEYLARFWRVWADSGGDGFFKSVSNKTKLISTSGIGVGWAPPTIAQEFRRLPIPSAMCKYFCPPTYL